MSSPYANAHFAYRLYRPVGTFLEEGFFYIRGVWLTYVRIKSYVLLKGGSTEPSYRHMYTLCQCTLCVWTSYSYRYMNVEL